MRRRTTKREAQYTRPLYVDLLQRTAANVRLLRAERGWSQEEAAFRCDEMSTYVFQCIEAGTSNFTATTLARLAHGFAIDPQVLLAPAPPPPKRKRGRPAKAKPEQNAEPSLAPTPDPIS